MPCSICHQNGHNKRTCELTTKVATTGKYAGLTAVQIEAIFAERERKNYEELVAPIIAQAKLACKEEEEEDEVQKCSQCEIELGEDIHIFCFSKGDDETTMCSNCADELTDEMRALGWKRDDDAYTCGLCGHSFKADEDFVISVDKHGRPCCDYCPDEEDECHDCNVSKSNEGGCDCQIIACSECGDENHKYNHTLGVDGLLRCDDCYSKPTEEEENECDCCGENFEKLNTAFDAEGCQETYCDECWKDKIEDGCVWQDENGQWAC